MLWKSLVAAFVGTLFLSAALAKGNFQGEGIVSEVQKSGEEVTFRYVGSISLAYATAPAGDPKRQWNSITVDTANILVRIRNWTESHNPSKRANLPDVDRIFQMLSALAVPGRKVVISVDNPSLSFSNLGDLTAIDGTYVYAVESPN
jgi:hypothetical protein